MNVDEAFFCCFVDHRDSNIGKKKCAAIDEAPKGVRFTDTYTAADLTMTGWKFSRSGNSINKL